MRETLEQYLRREMKGGAIDFEVRATEEGDGAVTFYVHPDSRDGESADFEVMGNTLRPNPRVTRPEDDAAAAVTYGYGHDEEWYHGSFASREDALAEGRAEGETDETVWTGRCVMLTAVDLVSVEGVLDQAADRAAELCGDAAEGWPCASTADTAELERRLDATLQTWLDETGNAPTCYRVVDVEQHVAETTAEDDVSPL